MTNYKYITDNTSYEYTQALQLFSTTTLSLGLDTETTGLDCFINNIRLLQVSTVDFTYMFDAFVMDIKPLCEILISRAKRKEINIYAHNFKFDIKMLWAMGIDFGLANILDTMNMAKIYTGGSLLGYSLADCCEKFINKTVDKTEQVSQWDAEVLTDSQLGYAALDPQLTAQLGEKLHQHIIREHLERVLELETKVLPATACMEYYGVMLDVDKLRQLEPRYKQLADTAKETFLDFIPVRQQRLTITGEVYDDGFNPASSAQVLEFMRDLHVPNPMYGMPGNEDKIICKTGANVLSQLDPDTYPFIEPLLSYKKYTKLLTGYVYNLPELLNSKTGLIHTHYNQIVSTGRFSSSNPNLQNIARPEYGEDITIRSCFIPRSPDNIFVGNDYSQIELRVIAELLASLYDDDLMLEEFKQGKDPYLSTASLLSGTPYEDMIDIVEGQHIPKKSVKQVRQNAKAVRLGANYCQSLSTQIATQQGVKRIKDITTDDKVLTHLGTFEDVLEVQRVYTDVIYKVTTSNDKHLTMTPDHMMQVILPIDKKHKENRYDWIEAQELKVGDYLVPNITEYGHAETPYFSSIAHAQLTGWFISEGSYSNYNFSIAQDKIYNPEIYAKMQEVLTPLGFYVRESNPNVFALGATQIKTLKETIDIQWQDTSKNKTFFNIRDLLTREEKIALLGALWDGDGCICVSKGKLNIMYASLSRHLLEDIQYVLLTLGIHGKINQRKTGLYVYDVRSRQSKEKFCEIIDIHKTIKGREYYAQGRRYTYTSERIVAIQRLDVKQHPMADITVANAHSFIAEGLVSHNCMGAAKFRLYAKHQYKVDMTIKEAKDYVGKYTSGYPGLGKYHNAMKDKSLRACYTFPPFNRPRKWDIYPGPAGLVNGPIQGSAGDCLKLAMAWLYIELDKLGYGPCKSWDIMLLLNIHDELIIECKKELQELAMQLSETYMVKAAKTVLKKVPVDAKPCLMPTLADKA